MAYGARSHGAALAKGARGGGKAHELLRLCRDADLLRRLPRMARAARSPRNLHHSAKPAPNPKNRMKPGAERTFRIAGPVPRALSSANFSPIWEGLEGATF